MPGGYSMMGLTIPDNIIPAPDLEQVRRALELFVPPGGTFEIRGLPSRRSYVGRDIDAAVAAIVAYDRAAWHQQRNRKRVRSFAS